MVIPSLALIFLLALASDAGPIQPGPEYRLNMKIRDIDYNIKLIITDESIGNKTFRGEMSVSFELEEAVNELSIHSDKDIPHDNIIISQNNTNVEIYELIAVKDAKILTIYTTNKLNPNDGKITMMFKYTGTIYEDMFGLYISKPSKNSKEATILTTQFAATHARRAFPCFDEPAYKATFRISIRHPSRFTSVVGNQNGKTVKFVTDPSQALTTFDKTPKMSTYSVAFMLSTFKSIETKNNNKIYAPERLITNADYAQSVSDRILDALGNYLGLPYGEIPYVDKEGISTAVKKLDQVAIPDMAMEAMENWGLVTYRETAILWDSMQSNQRDKQTVTFVIAHEFAHMWFGNLVTLSWWDNTWLNEGFANFFQYHGTDLISEAKSWDLENQFVLEQQQSVFLMDATETTKALNNKVSSPADIQAKFGQISYNKGACIIRMMKNYMGDEMFRSALNKYLSANKYGNVEPYQLYEELGQNNMKTGTGDVMKTWVENAGYPVIDVKLDGDSNIEITQRRFTYTNQKMTEKWAIPISYNNEYILFSPDEDSINIKINSTEHFLINDNNGYFRVNYDDTLLKRITDALKSETGRNQISAINRAQIIDDLMNLARAGITSYAKVFTLLDYLSEEIHYYPWYSAFNAFSYLIRRLPEDNVKEYVTEYLKDLMRKFYDEAKNFKIMETDSYIQVYQKVLALQWACELNIGLCKDNALKLFMDRNTKSINPDLRSVVYCVAARHDNDKNENWESLMQMFDETVIASEKVTILTALGCSKDKSILSTYLEMSIDERKIIRRQDALLPFTAVLTGNSEGVDVALQFLLDNSFKIKTAYGDMNALQTVVSALADRITTSDQATKLTEFMKAHRDFIENDDVIASAIETININTQWVEKNHASLRDYFNQETTSDTTIAETTTITADTTTSDTTTSDTSADTTIVDTTISDSTSSKPNQIYQIQIQQIQIHQTHKQPIQIQQIQI